MRPIRLLLVEDRSSDAELVIHELRRAGLDPRWERVEDESGFRARLDPSLDLILADYNLPQFDARRALAILKESRMDIPFIIVSGSIGDKAAVESMRSGASDYIFKDNLSRLAAAARRELEAADRRKAEARARAESAARLSAIIGSAPDAVVSMDEGGRILGWNPQAELMFGWTAQEAVGRLLVETIIPPALRQAHTAGLARYLATGEEHVLNRRVEVTAIHRDGREFPVELSIASITLAGRQSFSGFIRDITDRRRAAQTTSAHLAVSRALAESGSLDEVLVRILEAVGTNVGWDVGQVWLRDPADGLLWCAHRWLAAGSQAGPFDTDSSAARFAPGKGVVGHVWVEKKPLWLEDIGQASDPLLVEAASRSGLRSAAVTPLLSGNEVNGVVEFFSHRTQEADPMLVQLMSDLSRRIGEYISRAQAEAALHYRASHDALTELPNRIHFRERLGQAIQSANGAAVLLLNLDHFNDVNDAFGYLAGDELLRQVGPRIQQCIRAEDVVVRVGGDEFGILLHGADQEGAWRAASEIAAAFEEPFAVLGHPLAVGASIGMAISPEHGGEDELLIRRADIAMHVAKRSRGTVALYSSDYEERGASRLTLMADLRRAIHEGGLALHYQPVIELRSRAVVRFEALLRWKHAVHGMVAPDRFISFAEQTGVIQPLTDWVLKTALTQLRSWQVEGHDLRVSVNISMRNLLDPGLTERLAGLLETNRREPGSRAQSLTLEVTESVVMADPERALERLGRLRRLGLRLSVDDFGTGYSSLTYLSRLPVSEMKIDRSFVLGIADDPGKAAIVRAAIDLGHSLRLEVVAEGVEDRRTWDLLFALGCDTAQGYYMSRPMPADAVLPWLASSAGDGAVWRAGEAA